ncbi:hypothetical protein Bca52824_065902 [Brassica carinata]|uniref:Uncharacterized protein n=1 Tax=Brassica carinata TaxID=52824 RepID=A0A8X7QL11_BRACI|nr:hypothetical protein Bca52824_065902 [Brassica carinata]
MPHLDVCGKSCLKLKMKTWLYQMFFVCLNSLVFLSGSGCHKLSLACRWALVCGHKLLRGDARHAEMLEDTGSFLQYPWGERHSPALA